MALAEKAELIITSDYGYGDAGSPPEIPGGATMTFTIELSGLNTSRRGKSTEAPSTGKQQPPMLRLLHPESPKPASEPEPVYKPPPPKAKPVP